MKASSRSGFSLTLLLQGGQCQDAAGLDSPAPTMSDGGPGPAPSSSMNPAAGWGNMFLTCPGRLRRCAPHTSPILAPPGGDEFPLRPGGQVAGTGALAAQRRLHHSMGRAGAPPAPTCRTPRPPCCSRCRSTGCRPTESRRRCRRCSAQGGHLSSPQAGPRTRTRSQVVLRLCGGPGCN